MNVVIKFSGNFCIPCQQLKPIFDDVVKDISDIKVVEIDVEEYPETASIYGVRSVPTSSHLNYCFHLTSKILSCLIQIIGPLVRTT
jgi:thiol-disulfide isomerase/thioredoxin